SYLGLLAHGDVSGTDALGAVIYDPAAQTFDKVPALVNDPAAHVVGLSPDGTVAFDSASNGDGLSVGLFDSYGAVENLASVQGNPSVTVSVTDNSGATLPDSPQSGLSTITVPQSDLDHVELTPAAGFTGEIQLSAYAPDTESGGNSANSATDD